MAEHKTRIIINELANPLPISAEELALIETYFALEIFALTEEPSPPSRPQEPEL